MFLNLFDGANCIKDQSEHRDDIGDQGDQIAADTLQS